jgi:RNA polymerase sigma factor (TIGR02999 family)
VVPTKSTKVSRFESARRRLIPGAGLLLTWHPRPSAREAMTIRFGKTFITPVAMFAPLVSNPASSRPSFCQKLCAEGVRMNLTMGVPDQQMTELLHAAGDGDSQAAERLMELVYQELRSVAAAKMAQQPPGQTLQATALVHEAWLRLGGDQMPRWQSRRHFFAAAAQAMRHVLIERARKKLSARHGGEREPVDLDAVVIPAPGDDERLIEINSALDDLAAIAPEKAEVVKLRFFIGLSEKETAEVLHLSPRTVERYWSYAKAWLFERSRKTHP